MTPTWYDLLGVDPSASPEEIRAAWKAGISDLDPTDRRFRSLNQAAEVLLDPARRSEYDASLPAEEPAAEEAPGDQAPADGSGETEAHVESGLAIDEEQGSPARTPRAIPAWLLAVLAVLVAILLACAGYLYRQPSDDAVASSTSDAQAAAERAVTTILAYDYRHLDADQKAADELMTPAYQKKYDPLFTQIAANAPDLKASVSVQVVASGIVRSGEDRVQVLVFVDRPTTRSDGSSIYRDQVVVTMQRQDGQWLVDDLDTNQLAG